MPVQPLALENNNEKAVAKVKIDLKATKAKAPESKKSVDFVVPNLHSLVLKPNSDSKDEILPTPPPPLIQVPNTHQQPNLAASTTNGTSNQVKLERILGLTVPNNAALASAPARGLVAYPAGCTVVLLNTRKNRQNHIINPSRKTITSLAFSEDGRYLVTGECGHAPCVRIWDVAERQQISEFPGHKFGVNVVAFAPNGKYVVSVGSQQDMIVNVWDWHNNIKVASNKISTKVKAISFAENGNYFVTAGNRHIKFWYLEYSRSKYKEPVPLMGRSAILGEQRNNYFCDVACGRGDMGDSTFAVTRSGLLCEFNNRRLLDKWVELKTQGANCLSVGEDFIFIGCTDGIVRCFSPHTLQFITTLPRTHYLGVDISKGLTIGHMVSHPQGARYPDTTAVTYDEQNFKVTVIYNDHSLYVWDVRDIKKVGKSHSFLFHSACIWGVETYPVLGDGQKPVLPPGSFVTCSSDDTIRIWNMSSQMANTTIYKRNIYSDDLLKTLYIDTDLNHIKESDTSNTAESGSSSQSKDNSSTVYDQKNGVRCIRISPDGKHLASGDRAGNVRVHDIQFMDELCKIEAHDAEVLCLEYSTPVSVGKVGSPLRQRSLLASASRDRLIHVFDACREYSFVHTLDDHSSSITAIRFLKMPPRPGVENSVQIASCGADKSIIFRDITSDHKGGLEFTRGNHIVGKTTLYDMETDYNHKHILTACQDRNVRVYTIGNGKHIKTFKGSAGDDGTLIKVVLDRSGVYLATSCTDKTISIYDFHSGDCMATMFGHSELVTGLKFTNDCRHLISVSGDGCIFVWRLPQEMTSTMLNRLAQLETASPAKSRAYIAMEAPKTPETFASSVPEMPPPPSISDNDYRFSVGKLPVWAKKQLATGDPSSAQSVADMPKGRWAARVGGQVTVKSHYDSDSVIPFPGNNKENKNNNSEHDADIDEYSDTLTMNEDGGESTEPEQHEKTLFFGGMQQNNETPGNYTVNAIDVEELRKSQRRTRPSDLAVTNPSQESDFEEDEDGLSTPTAEKSMTSMLSVSSENVERVGRRERFMKSNFESLQNGQNEQSNHNNTISNQFREGSAIERNAVTIARAQSLRDSEQNRRREELQKRIEDTRRKLQNIGYQSMLRGSQSISDLTSHLPDKHQASQHRSESVMSDYQTHINSKQYGEVSSRPSSTEPNSLDHNSSLRRACSLSDLNRPAVTKRLLPAPPVSGKKQSIGNKPQRYRAQPNLDVQSTSPEENVPSYMRSTSASAKKERPVSAASVSVAFPQTPRRRSSFGQTQSTLDLRSTALDDDSSSEENMQRSLKGRRRSSSHDRRGGTNGLPLNGLVTQSERDLTKVTKVRVKTTVASPNQSPNTKEPSLNNQPKPRTKMKTTTMIIGGSADEPVGPLQDVVRAPLNWQLVDSTVVQLQKASDDLVQLYKRISLDYEMEDSERAQMLQKLAFTAGISQQTLKPVNPMVDQPPFKMLQPSRDLQHQGPSWC